MTTKLGKVFLSILDKCFPVGHVLRRVFNRHTLQLSYRTMPNMASIIAGNNRRLLKQVPGELPEQLPPGILTSVGIFLLPQVFSAWSA